MTDTDKAPTPPAPKAEHPSAHRNPFGEHPDGIGPTLGEDLDEDEKPGAVTGER